MPDEQLLELSYRHQAVTDLGLSAKDVAANVAGGRPLEPAAALGGAETLRGAADKRPA